MQFLQALSPGRREIIVLTGAGGKTSAMFAMAKEAVKEGRKVILAITTKIYEPEGWNVLLADEPEILCRRINSILADDVAVVVGEKRLPGFPPKLTGLDTDLFASLASTSADLIIVEADGSAGLPFKAPAEHEPVIPPGTTLVMPVVGIDCIGLPLNPANVHRPRLVAQIAGADLESRVTAKTVAAVLTSTDGYRKNVPPQARWIPFINKVQTAPQMAAALDIAREITAKIPSSVLIGAAMQKDPVREVVGP
ncbi:selenium cofactor biosynthesis protein YqeC [Dethiobacter alkaliphilus]|uniref:selenium cofactor biosynthesis protein YqeC n=1 Tax=Dethiobacter alkaliphilus TaxID=427926 RepID=UPI002225FB51|nr:selenium cofactor biosynthesis protein YqeC [Dethiobacter alkaliphilus]MCW3490139.1 selenium cofactor biosynthesis protein YqeC [Dethiobacter alkaliphilus]